MEEGEEIKSKSKIKRGTQKSEMQPKISLDALSS